jgi:hypothetical protein
MIRLPFSHKSADEAGERAYAAFEDYCREELERRRDAGADLDEKRFRAAADLAAGRLRAMEILCSSQSDTLELGLAEVNR